MSRCVITTCCSLAAEQLHAVQLKCNKVQCYSSTMHCLLMQVDSGTWSTPDILPGPSPGARAFHCAVALGQRLLLFGGHILTFDADHNRKRRTFFNDLWQLDTVRGAGSKAACWLVGC
jgi:hypothetical protein